MLHIPKLDLDIHAQPILRNFQLSLHAGKCVGLVGESGSGKTLSAMSIIQLLPKAARVSADSQIFFHDQDLLNLTEKQMRQIRGKKIGMIFQDAMTAFNPVLTIGQQMMESIRLHLKYRKNKAKSHALTCLEEAGITESARCFCAYPHELSGGQRQRAMIAMAICVLPDIIIADEPTTALDAELQTQIIALLKRYQETKNCGLLFIGHDMALMKIIADDIIVLRNGEIIEKNTAKDFFKNPQAGYSRQLLAATLPTSAQKSPLQQAKPLLSIEKLSVKFPSHKNSFQRLWRRSFSVVVKDISFIIHQGETVALMGKSGSGKTTIAKAILRLLQHTHGKIIFDHRNLLTLAKNELRAVRADIQMIFQDSGSALNPRMTIRESLLEGLKIQKKLVLTQSEVIAVSLLKEVELSEKLLDRYPHELSGGQRQRVCIARALALSPKLLILDEPTSALDASTQMQILQLLARLQSEKQLSYLLITHSLGVANYLAHSVVKVQ